MPYYKYQHGGGNCSLCGAPGVTKTTCPFNPKAKNPRPGDHNTIPLSQIKGPKKPKKPKAPKKPKTKQPTKPKPKDKEKEQEILRILGLEDQPELIVAQLFDEMDRDDILNYCMTSPQMGTQCKEMQKGYWNKLIDRDCYVPGTGKTGYAKYKSCFSKALDNSKISLLISIIYNYAKKRKHLSSLVTLLEDNFPKIMPMVQDKKYNYFKSPQFDEDYINSIFESLSGIWYDDTVFEKVTKKYPKLKTLLQILPEGEFIYTTPKKSYNINKLNSLLSAIMYYNLPDKVRKSLSYKGEKDYSPPASEYTDDFTMAINNINKGANQDYLEKMLRRFVTNLPMAQLLIDNGANVKRAGEFWGNPLPEYVLLVGRTESPATIKFLVDNDALNDDDFLLRVLSTIKYERYNNFLYALEENLDKKTYEKIKNTLDKHYTDKETRRQSLIDLGYDLR